MTDRHGNPTLGRLLRDETVRHALDPLTSSLAGTDLTSLLLEVFRARAADRVPADLMRQYATDRFVSPGTVDALALGRIELAALEAASQDGFDPIVVAPVAPLGTHSVISQVPQNNVVSTARMSEVTADPTNSMALEAAVRRRQLLSTQARSRQVVRLAGHHRVVRAQHFDGPRSFAHFSLFGMVSAGRDRGSCDFEVDSLIQHAVLLAGVARQVTNNPVQILLTVLSDSANHRSDDVRDALLDAEIDCELWPEREQGRGYYQNYCFKLLVSREGEEFDVGDGGDVGWTQELLENRKERLTISGLGIERLAMLAQ